MQITGHNKVVLPSPVGTTARSDAAGRRLLDLLLCLEQLGHAVWFLELNVRLLLALGIHKLQGV